MRRSQVVSLILPRSHPASLSPTSGTLPSYCNGRQVDYLITNATRDPYTVVLNIAGDTWHPDISTDQTLAKGLVNNVLPSNRHQNEAGYEFSWEYQLNNISNWTQYILRQSDNQVTTTTLYLRRVYSPLCHLFNPAPVRHACSLLAALDGHFLLCSMPTIPSASRALPRCAASPSLFPPPHGHSLAALHALLTPRCA